MAHVANARNGLSMGATQGARTAYETYSSIADENQPVGRTSSVTSNARSQNAWGSPPQPVTSTSKDAAALPEPQPATKVNGNSASNSDEEIPENMYLPEKQDPEGWIHRDKLAKIESEELQAAGINLANARSRSQSKIKSVRSTSSSEWDSRREEKRQRLDVPTEVEVDNEGDHESWDFRLPEEIEADNAAASQMYASPVLRKSGSKIPVLTSSPIPIPPERYERDTPIARKRAVSGTMSLEGDLNISKRRSGNWSKDESDLNVSKRRSGNWSRDSSDVIHSAFASSKSGSPQKLRSQSATVSGPAGFAPKKTVPANRKVSAPVRATPSPNQRPGTRSGDQDRPRTAINRPEGDAPWLATMYKPDPRLPPDQQLIPTLAKKQAQAQWAADGAIPKAYDKDFAPIDIHDEAHLARNSWRARTPSPAKFDQDPVPDDRLADPQEMGISLRPVSSIRSNSGRPGTSGSITGGYSTMPKVLGPPVRESSPKIGSGSFPAPAMAERSTTQPPPTRMQAQNLAEEDEKVKKGCGCCVVM